MKNNATSLNNTWFRLYTRYNFLFVCGIDLCLQVRCFDLLRPISATAVALRSVVGTTFSVRIFIKSVTIVHQINYDLFEDLYHRKGYYVVGLVILSMYFNAK